jgi:hypothetical protein
MFQSPPVKGCPRKFLPGQKDSMGLESQLDRLKTAVVM